MNARYLVFLIVLSACAAELPQASDYPAELTKIDHYANATIPDVREASRCIRNLAYDHAAAPDFADRFTLFVTGCGSGCAEFCLVDRISGAVFPGFCAGGGPSFDFTRDSRLVVMKHTDGMYGDDDQFFADCYVWGKDQFRFLGRWATKYGIARREKRIDWSPIVTLAPNRPSWRSK